MTTSRLITYSGNYDTFRSTRALQQEVRARQAEKVEQQRRHLQSFVDRFRYKASKAKQAQSRMKMLEKLETVDLMEDAAATVFNFPEPDDLPPPLLTIEDGAVGYNGVPVLKKLNLQIVDNDRIALLGANGNGKSTLAKLLSAACRCFPVMTPPRQTSVSAVLPNTQKNCGWSCTALMI